MDEKYFFLQSYKDTRADDIDENYDFFFQSCDDTMRDDDIDVNLRSRSFLENDESNELQILWTKKEKLSKTKEQQEKYKAEVQVSKVFFIYTYSVH